MPISEGVGGDPTGARFPVRPWGLRPGEGVPHLNELRLIRPQKNDSDCDCDTDSGGGGGGGGMLAGSWRIGNDVC
jgi:hypothetical protein